ncbi:MAG: hypothetical protein AB7F43_09435 [Bacteriovoracia bacterium]
MGTTLDQQTTRYFAELERKGSANNEYEPFFPLSQIAAKIGSVIIAGLRALGEHSKANLEVHDRINGRIHDRPAPQVRSCL